MKLLAGAALTAALMAAGAANATVIFNETFEEYNPQAIAHDAHGASAGGYSITTDYSYRVPTPGVNTPCVQPCVDNSMYGEGTWSIVNNPIDVHNLWIDLPVADQTGQMLIINGSTQNGSNVIGDPNADPVAYLGGDIAVGAGSYDFSYNLLNVCCNANGPPHTPSVLDLWYTPSGGPIVFTQLTIDQTSLQSNGWGLIQGSFNLAQGGTIRIGLSDLTGDASGNDFAVDNIQLASVPEPASWALMLVGFGGLGAILRRQRRAAVAA